jgi:molybdopterin-binding protein
MIIYNVNRLENLYISPKIRKKSKTLNLNNRHVNWQVKFMRLLFMTKISARNVLKGKVKKIVVGAVNSEITVELPNEIEIVSIITKSSAERLELKVGKEVWAVIKASNVMIATE